MELRQLIHFQVAARFESFTRAAENLYISQPALSRSISRLEDELGVKLFDRTNSAIRLNQCGEAFLESVRAATSQLRSGENNARSLAGLSGGKVILVASYLSPLSGLLAVFLDSYPETDLICDVLPEDFVFIKLRRFSADFGFTLHPVAEDSDLTCRPLAHDPLGVYLPFNHPWHGRTSISVEELDAQTLLVQTAGQEDRKHFESQCRHLQISPRIRIASSQLSLILHVSANEKLPVLVSSYSAKQAGIRLVPIAEAPFSRTLYVSHHREKRLSLAAQSLQSLMSDYFSPKNY